MGVPRRVPGGDPEGTTFRRLAGRAPERLPKPLHKIVILRWRQLFAPGATLPERTIMEGRKKKGKSPKELSNVPPGFRRYVRSDFIIAHLFENVNTLTKKNRKGIFFMPGKERRMKKITMCPCSSTIPPEVISTVDEKLRNVAVIRCRVCGLETRAPTMGEALKKWDEVTRKKRKAWRGFCD